MHEIKPIWHKAAARSRSLFSCWELPDRRTRAIIEYELKLQCKLLLELSMNQDHIIKCGKDQDWIGLAAQESHLIAL